MIACYIIYSKNISEPLTLPITIEPRWAHFIKNHKLNQFLVFLYLYFLFFIYAYQLVSLIHLLLIIYN